MTEGERERKRKRESARVCCAHLFTFVCVVCFVYGRVGARACVLDVRADEKARKLSIAGALYAQPQGNPSTPATTTTATYHYYLSLLLTTNNNKATTTTVRLGGIGSE